MSSQCGKRRRHEQEALPALGQGAANPPRLRAAKVEGWRFRSRFLLRRSRGRPSECTHYVPPEGFVHASCMLTRSFAPSAVLSDR